MKHIWEKWTRWVVLGVLLFMVTYGAWAHQVYGGSKAISIHGICPFGGLESLYQYISSGNLIAKVAVGTMILFGVTVLLAILFRRSFCGTLCPFGALQEAFGFLGKKIFGRSFTLPQKIDGPLRYLKYGVLVLTVFYAWKTAGLWMAPYDPWTAYGHLFSNDPIDSFQNAWGEMPIGLILLAITLLGSLLYDRFFCKYLCPVGALYGIIGKISPFRVVRNESACVSCGKCSAVCPVNIEVHTATTIRSAECIDCQLCTLSCPKKGALTHRLGKWNLKPWMVLVLVVGLFGGSLLIAQQVTPYKTELKAPITEPLTSAEELKGYMTLEESAKTLGVPLKDFYQKMGIPETVPPETQLKSVESMVEGFDFHKAKDNYQ